MTANKHHLETPVIYIFPRNAEHELSNLLLSDQLYHIFCASDFMPSSVPACAHATSISKSIINSNLWLNPDTLLQACVNESAQHNANQFDILGIAITAHWLYHAHLMMHAVASEVAEGVSLGFNEICVHGDFAKHGVRFYNGLDKYSVLQILRCALVDMQVINAFDLQSTNKIYPNQPLKINKVLLSAIWNFPRKMRIQSKRQVDIYIGPGIKAREVSTTRNIVFLYDPSLTSFLDSGMIRIEDRGLNLLTSSMKNHEWNKEKHSYAYADIPSADDKEALLVAITNIATDNYAKKKQRLIDVAGTIIGRRRGSKLNILLSDQMNIDSMALLGALNHHLGTDTSKINIVSHSNARKAPLSVYASRLFPGIFRPTDIAVRIPTLSHDRSLCLSNMRCILLAASFAHADICFEILTYAPYKTHNCKYDISIYSFVLHTMVDGLKQISGARLRLNRKPGSEPLTHGLDIHPDFSHGYFKEHFFSASGFDESLSAKVYISLCHFGDAHLKKVFEGNIVICIACDEAQYIPELCYIDYSVFIDYCVLHDVSTKALAVARLLSSISDSFPIHIVTSKRNGVDDIAVDLS